MDLPDAELRMALRTRMRAERRALPGAEVASGSARMLEALAMHPWFLGARVVAAYIGVGGEPRLVRPAAGDDDAPTDPLVALRHDPVRTLALPRVEGPGLVLHAWRGEALVPGALRIPEPPATLPVVRPEDVDLWLVPGVAFDRAGNRLGQGAGYYDRLLAHAAGRKLGTGWMFQVLAEVPHAAHDVPMDALLTEAGWLDR